MTLVLIAPVLPTSQFTMCGSRSRALMRGASRSASAAGAAASSSTSKASESDWNSMENWWNSSGIYLIVSRQAAEVDEDVREFPSLFILNAEQLSVHFLRGEDSVDSGVWGHFPCSVLKNLTKQGKIK